MFEIYYKKSKYLRREKDLNKKYLNFEEKAYALF